MSGGGYYYGGYYYGGYDDGGYGDDDFYDDGYGIGYDENNYYVNYDVEDYNNYVDEEIPYYNGYLGKKFQRNFIEENYDENEYDDDDEEEEDSYEFNCETGEIGEEIVYNDIKKLKHKGKIEWMNKDCESFKPYDFIIKKGNKIIYIDAKSTVCEKFNDPLPIISQNEEEFIFNLMPNERYYIARVYNARSENPTIEYFNAVTLEKVNKKDF